MARQKVTHEHLVGAADEMLGELATRRGSQAGHEGRGEGLEEERHLGHDSETPESWGGRSGGLDRHYNSFKSGPADPTHEELSERSMVKPGGVRSHEDTSGGEGSSGIPRPAYGEDISPGTNPRHLTTPPREGMGFSVQSSNKPSVQRHEAQRMEYRRDPMESASNEGPADHQRPPKLAHLGTSEDERAGAAFEDMVHQGSSAEDHSPSTKKARSSREIVDGLLGSRR